MAVFFFIGSLVRFDRVTVCVWFLVEDLGFFFFHLKNVGVCFLLLLPFVALPLIPQRDYRIMLILQFKAMYRNSHVLVSTLFQQASGQLMERIQEVRCL